MNLSTLKKIEEYAKKQMGKSRDLLHDWNHIERVKQNAMDIVDELQIEDIDKNLLLACCLLHDLGYAERQIHYVSMYIWETKITCSLLKKVFKKELRFIDKTDQKIIFKAIWHHALSFPFRKLNKRGNRYCKILQDADTIDYFCHIRRGLINEITIVERIYTKLRFIYNFGNNNLGVFLNYPKLADRFGRIKHCPQYFKEYGKNNKKNLVVIGGYASTVNDFHYFGEKLKTKYHVVVISLPMGYGFGLRLRIDELIHYIDNIVKDLEIESFELAGFSFGGLVATRYTTVFPKKVKRLVLLSILPKLLINNGQALLYKILKPIITSSWWARIYVKLNTSDIVRKIYGSQKIHKGEANLMKREPESIFTTLFENADINLKNQFNRLKVEKLVFLSKDDQVFKWKRFLKQKNEFKTKYCFSNLGGHNLDINYQKEVMKIWIKK